MYSLLFLGFAGFVLSLFITPAVRNVFRRLGLVDKPDQERKLHDRPVPRVGGIAIAIAYVLAFGLLLISGLNGATIVWSAFPLIWRLVPAASIILITGLLDDLYGISPWHKLAGQLAAALVAYFAGIHVLGVGGTQFSHWWALPATLLWLIACSNALNLIDGLDGLAAGIGLVATTTTLLAALMQHNVELALATLPLAGCLVAFLRYNFNPATIFLGDSGSLLIGFLLGCYGALWSQKSATILGMVAPVMTLSIPLLDASLAVVRRFLRRQPIFGADRGHIHHRLLDRGLTPRRVALLLYAVCTVTAVLALSLVDNHFEVPVILLFCAAAGVGIQRLGYVEFNTAGRMLLEGSFRRLLNSQILLRNFEAKLLSAGTPEECWSLLKKTYQDFGFCQIQVRLAGSSYHDESAEPPAARGWRVEIPISDDAYVYLTSAFGSDSRYSIVGPFAEILRKVLPSRFPSSAAPADILSIRSNLQHLEAALEPEQLVSVHD